MAHKKYLSMIASRTRAMEDPGKDPIWFMDEPIFLRNHMDMLFFTIGGFMLSMLGASLYLARSSFRR
jgi:hypothetical protein